jgi:hypothetical protein
MTNFIVEHKPCHEFLYAKNIRGNSCFVISLYAFLDIKDVGVCERKTGMKYWNCVFNAEIYFNFIEIEIIAPDSHFEKMLLCIG